MLIALGIRSQHNTRPPMTECNTKTRSNFHPEKPVDFEFDVPQMTTDAGAVLLRQMDGDRGLCEMLAKLLPDEREQQKIEHTRLEQLRQRVFQIAMGWADQNDADRLRDDPVWKTVVDRSPDDEELASQPTLSLFENAPGMRTNKRLMEALEFEWMSRIDDDRDVVVLDVDSSGFEGHGQQELLEFCGFHGAHIHHPLFVLDAETNEVVTALLRPGDVGDSRGVIGIVRRLIGRLKSIRPNLDVVVRGDAGFAQPRMYQALERLDRIWGGIGYLFGISKNSAFERKLEDALETSRRKFEATGSTSRTYQWFEHRAQSWSKTRSILGKAEVGSQGDNPRFVVTNIDEFPPRLIYENAYCPRGEAENTVKSLKTHLRADRLSCSSFEANFFRLLEHVIAHRILTGLKRTCTEEAQRRRKVRRKRDQSSDHAPEDTDEQNVIDQLARLGEAQLDTLRLLLLKIAAIVTESTRRIHVRMPQAFPMAPAFHALTGRLDAP